MSLSFYPIETDSDLIFLNEVRNECAAEFLHCSNVYTVEDTIKWYKTLATPYYMVCIGTDRIGYFRTSNYSKDNRNIYIGMDIHQDWRGKKLAFPSYCMFVPFIFKTFDLHKIALEVLSTNIRAISLYRKLGFVIEGIKRDEVLKNGRYVDSIVMSLLKKEMEEGKIYSQ